MTTLSGIHAEIERLSEERAELWHQLSAEYDARIRDDIRRLDAELDRLWNEHRMLRARLRFGDRESIVLYDTNAVVSSSGVFNSTFGT